MHKIRLLLMGMLLLSHWAISQTTVRTGKVTDASGAPVVGATVQEKGTGNATVTDRSGEFRIQAKNNAVLVISSVGLETKEVPSTGNLQVSLGVNNQTLAEVVVTGVGVATSKRKLGISVEAITAAKLPPTPTASIDQALIGKIPGAYISSTSGNPGDPVNIVLRGINSLGGTKPLILVDGVQVASTDINSLDLSNIERVEVVQGAASATLYGAQGANGAIQIFTKRGKRGAPQVSFSTSYAQNEFLNVGKVHKSMLHPYKTDAAGNILDDVTGQPVQFNEDGTLPRISYRYGAPHVGAGAASRLALLGPENVNDQPYNANLKYYDHFKQVFLKGFTLNSSVSLSGGSDRSDYNLNVSNNLTESPILKNGRVNRTNLSLNVGTELLKGLNLRSTTQLIYTKNTLKPFLGLPGGVLFGSGDANFFSSPTFAQAVSGAAYGFLNTSPFFDLYYRQPDGNYTNYLLASFLSVNTANPVYNTVYSDGLDNKIDVVQSFDLNYRPIKWVELDARYGINYRNEVSRWTFYNQTENVSTATYGSFIGAFAPDASGEINNYQAANTYQNLLTSATIRTDFQNDFHINVPIRTSTLFTYDYRKNKYTEYDTYGVGLPLQPPINIQSTGAQAVIFDYEQPFTTYGYLVDQKIEIGDWGGVNGGFRTDWSSNFGAGLSFTFPHGNAYIMPSAFGFWKNSSIGKAFSYFKLRGAYGEAGIQPVFGVRYPGLNNANLGTQLAYFSQINANNEKIKVERTKELEVGTDFSFAIGHGAWFGSVNGSFTYWKRKSVDVISNISQPISTGTTSIFDNAVDLSSEGMQAQLNLPIYKGKDFNWDFTVNFGKARSLIDKVNGEIAQFTAAAGAVQLKLIEGQPIGQIFGYKALTSVDQLREDGKTRFISEADRGKYEIVEGKVVDTALKSIYFSDEASFIGDPNPKFNMSFINGISFKDFLSFNFQLDWVHGNHLYNQTKEWMYRDGIHSDFDKPVTINGRTAAFTAYHGSAYYGLAATPSGPGNNTTKDYFYEDASFLRLRNVSVGFNVLRFWKQKAFKKLELVFTGRNIWTDTKYTGFDPELNSGPSNSSFERGIDHSTLPNIKSYQVGLNVTF